MPGQPRHPEQPGLLRRKGHTRRKPGSQSHGPTPKSEVRSPKSEVKATPWTADSGLGTWDSVTVAGPPSASLSLAGGNCCEAVSSWSACSGSTGSAGRGRGFPGDGEQRIGGNPGRHLVRRWRHAGRQRSDDVRRLVHRLLRPERDAALPVLSRAVPPPDCGGGPARLRRRMPSTNRRVDRLCPVRLVN
jgi:hypothetical protein